METGGHPWCASGADRALLKCLGDRQANQVEASTIHAGQKGGHQGRNNPTLSCWFYQRGVSSGVVSQSGSCKKKE